MKKIDFTFICILSFFSANSQITLPVDGNKKASVSEDIGITKVRIEYSRPAVNGREGKIWGNLIHYGFSDLGYGTSKAAPWRAGANENTTFEISTDVSIEGKPLKAGKYGFFIAMATDKATLVFSNFNTAWGSFYYDPKDDALRVDVRVKKMNEITERLKYEFDHQTDSSAELSLRWEKIVIPFTVSVDLKKIQIESFRREINSGMFYRFWQNMHAAANYCLVNNINLEEGLSWAHRSIFAYFGEQNFLTLSTYAGLLRKFDRNKEADSIMAKAIPLGTPAQLVMYGNNLNKLGRTDDAFKILKMNYDKHSTEEYGILSMAMGYYFLKNDKMALQFARKGLQSTTNTGWKGYFETVISNINEGKNPFR